MTILNPVSERRKAGEPALTVPTELLLDLADQITRMLDSRTNSSARVAAVADLATMVAIRARVALMEPIGDAESEQAELAGAVRRAMADAAGWLKTHG